MDTPPASSLLQKDVNALVHEWRKSSASVPTAVLATSPAQPNTPPAPTERDEAGTSRDTTVAEGLEARTVIDLADYDWSVSSRGPRTPYTPADGTPVTAKLARSIHLAERTYGSVILTPSTQTSWGPGISPADFTPISNASRYPSPDIAARMIEDSPCSPSTATSWGPSSSCWASSPVSQIIRLPSPDIAARMIEDAPRTPSTATTWGPPLSFPPTPAHYNVNGDFYRLPSPDIGQRTFDETAPKVVVSEEKPSRLGWPFFVPRTEEEIKAAKLGWPFFRPTREEATGAPRLGWPFFKPTEASTFGGPSHSRAYSDMSFASRSLPVTLPRAAAAYPIFDLYPPAYPNLEIYPDVSPVKSREPVGKAVIVALPRPAPCYPTFELYPPAYPNLEIYPDVSPCKLRPVVNKTVIVSLPHPAPSYPDFDLYPAGYPNLVIYPDVVSVKRLPTGGSLKGKSLPVALPRPAPCYPDFDLYPAGYPHLEIYPAIAPPVVSASRPAPKPVSVRLSAPAVVYPEFNIYPATYPTLIIYPSVVPSRKQSAASPKSVCEISVRLPPTTGYPVFDLYPAVYPEMIIYPLQPLAATVPAKRAPQPKVFVSSAGYPTFDLYPAVYPWVTPYPPCVFQPVQSVVRSASPQRWVPRKTHKMLHDEWVAAQTKTQIATVLPPPSPQPTAPLPPIPQAPLSAVPSTRSRARSGTVSRPLAAPPRSQLPPPPPPLQSSALPSSADVSPVQSTAPISRSREALHALIFGESDISAQEIVPSPVAESPSPLTAIAISPTVERAPTRRSPSLSPPGGIRVGLPSHPGITVSNNRKSVAERRATFAMQESSPTLSRSNTTSRMFPAPTRSLTVLAEGDDVPTLPKSPRSPLSRSVSLSRMKTNDDLFRKRQSLLNSPRRPSTADSNPLPVLSEFPSPPVSARSSMVGSPPGLSRPISKLDTSKYPFLR